MIDIISVDRNILILNNLTISEYLYLSEIYNQGSINIVDMSIIGKIDELSLESKGFIESYWQSSQGPGNRRKYYKITQYGIESLDKKVDEWNFVKNIMDKFLDGRDGNGSNK